VPREQLLEFLASDRSGSLGAHVPAL